MQKLLLMRRRLLLLPRHLKQVGFAGVIVDDARDGGAQAGEVRAAVDGVDGVGKGVN